MFNFFRKRKPDYKRNIVHVSFGDDGSIIHGVAIIRPNGQKEFHGYSYDNWEKASIDVWSDSIRKVLCNVARENGFSKMLYHYRRFDRKLNTTVTEKEFVDVKCRRRLAY